MDSKALGLLGLCARAGKVLSGEPAAEQAVKKKNAYLVLIDEEASENAKKALEEYFRTVVKEKVNRNLPGYKAVRKITLRYREFDKTTTKKIRRNSADNMEE